MIAQLCKLWHFYFDTIERVNMVDLKSRVGSDLGDNREVPELFGLGGMIACSNCEGFPKYRLYFLSAKTGYHDTDGQGWCEQRFFIIFRRPTPSIWLTGIYRLRTKWYQCHLGFGMLEQLSVRSGLILDTEIHFGISVSLFQTYY